MRRRLTFPLLVALLAATAVQQTARAQGVDQLPGDDGKLGQILRMGNDLPNKLDFTLKEARYTLGRLVMAGRSFSPSKDQKLLVLKYAIQNANKTDLLIRYDTVSFMAVDSQGVNHVSIKCIARSESDKETYQATLKPAQKVDLVTGIMVPAALPVPKVIVSYVTSKRVIRYAMNQMAKPLTPPFGEGGDSAPATIQARAGTFYPLGTFDVKYVGLCSVRPATPSLEKDKAWQGVTLTVKNPQNGPWLLRYDTFTIVVASNDGDKSRRTFHVFKANSDVDASRQLDPGEELTVRFTLKVPKGSTSTSVTVSEGQSHAYTFRAQ